MATCDEGAGHPLSTTVTPKECWPRCLCLVIDTVVHTADAEIIMANILDLSLWLSSQTWQHDRGAYKQDDCQSYLRLNPLPVT